MRAGRAAMALALLLRGEASAKAPLPDPQAARAALGEEDFSRYQAELNGLAKLNPLGREYASRAEKIASKWTERIWSGAFKTPAEAALAEQLTRDAGRKNGLKRELVEEMNRGRGDAFASRLRARTLELARAQLLLGPKGEATPLGRLLASRGVPEEALLAYYCTYEAGDGAAPESGARAQAESLRVRAPGAAAEPEDARERSAFEKGLAPESVDARERPSDSALLARHCSDWRKRREWTKPGEPAQSLAGRAVPEPGKPPASAAASGLWDGAKADVVGGLFGAAGVGLVGFVLGGPAGAVLGALVGFAVMAAVVHLNNHPVGRS